jgi:hypothetical protein
MREGGGIDFVFFWQIVGLAAIVYGVKYAVYWISGKVLNFRQMSQAIISSTVAINYLFALLMLPMLIVIYYTSSEKVVTLLYFIIAVISVIYLTLRIFKSIVTHSGLFPYSIFHLFIYLCTFEVIPLLVVIKVVINSID